MAVSTLASSPALASTRRFDPLRRPAARARPVVRWSHITGARAPWPLLLASWCRLDAVSAALPSHHGACVVCDRSAHPLVRVFC